MDVTTISTALTTDGRQAITPAPNSGTARGATGFSSDFETFLKMLTTQLRNQDPLNPIESSDFAVQLATFSTVEQQVLTNELLTDLGAQIGAQGLSQLSGWIGLEALASGPVAFSGQPVSLIATVEPQAESAEIVATNAQGIIVNRQPIPAQSGEVIWNGRDPAGLPVAEGEYTLSVLSFANDQTLARHAPSFYRQITEARFEAGETVLILEQGERISPAQVRGLRPLPE